jgi:hypothetical protein
MDEFVPDIKTKTEFYAAVGMFHVAWATIDLVMSYAIGQLLKISDEETHLLTAGMEFGRKATVLRNLVLRSSHRNKAKIIGALNRVQNDGKRNAITHGLMVFDSAGIGVTFIDRSRGGEYTATPHKFTYAEFTAHVSEFLNYTEELEVALDVKDVPFQAFARAAVSANKKAAKSPTPPSSKTP